MGQAASDARLVRFGTFEVDLRTRELRKAGLKLKLTGQPFEVLAILLECPGEVVTREDLQKRLWPDTFVDVEHNLNTAINRIREALGDSAESPRFVETLSRRGYRFIASVKPVAIDVAPQSGPVPVDTTRTNEQAPRPESAQMLAAARVLSWPRAVKLSLIAVVAATAIVIGWKLGWLVRSPAKTSPQLSIRSLAVLPLENLSGEPAQDYFADGMTDALITSLGQIGSLRVISRTSAMQYRGVHKPLPQIARELNVDAVVEGTVVRSNGQVRITAQLIQASTDKHLWSQSYQRDLKDVLGLQNEIANAIAKQIRVTLTPGEQLRAGTEQPVNLEAYESYLRGKYFLNRFTPDSLRKAADYFEQAIEKDPNYSPAYIRLASCYQLLGDRGAIPQRVAYPKAKVLIAKALELDPQLAIAHALRGWDQLDYDWDFAAASAEFQRAIELNPNLPEGHVGLSGYYAAMGRLQEAVQESQRAREVDPLDLIVNINLCANLYFARRYDEALAQCKANQDLDPTSPIPLAQLGGIYAAKGMDSEAAAASIQSLEKSGATPALVAALKTGARDSGLRGVSTAWLQFQQASIAAGKEDPMVVARRYIRARDSDKALTWLEKAFTARSTWIIYLGVDPAFDSLRSDPRFVSLLRRIGLPQGQARN